MNIKFSTTLGFALVAAFLAVSVVGCDDDEPNDECGGHGHLHDGHCDCDEGYVQDPDDEENCIEDTGENWCMEGRENWEQCDDDGVILWCHVMEGMEPHPHAGQDCAADGLECVQVSESDAACVDMSSSCTEGEHECSAENEALNCVDGHWSVEPCGSLQCHDEDDAAVCEEGVVECGGYGHLEGGECVCDEGYVQDPDDVTNCIDEVSFPQRACNTFAAGDPEEKSVVTNFDDVFTHETHADLDTLVRVTLPDNETSYIHFPITVDGNYVIFLDTDDVFVTAWHRDHSTEFTTTGGVANGMCETDLVDHWHISATYDGEDSNPVPGVLEFGPVDGGATVQFIVSLHADAPEPECGGHGHLHDGHCHCDEGYMVDPEDESNCIEIPFPQVACDIFAAGDPEEKWVTTTFDDVFAHDYHADLDTLVHVTLPGTSEPSYIHFPITEDGNYVIFLDTNDVFVTAWYRDHSTEFTTTGGVPNGMCETDLVDHWHISATYDGDGSGPVPGVLEFEPVDTETEVQFIVRLHEEDHDH